MREIWSYKTLQNIPESFRLSLGEGNTPLKSLQIEDLTVMIKDENHNPTGSFKDRSLAFQLAKHIYKGKKKFVISSSGNAGISAAAYANLAKVEMDIFVARSINPAKLEKLDIYKSAKVKVHISQKAKSDAMQFARANEAYNLRGSKDDAALVGFKTIAYELSEQYPQLDALFVPCSSGTSALGIAKGFAELKHPVKIYIAQTTRMHPIASYYDKDFVNSTASYADAIVDRVVARKQSVIKMIKQTGGSGFVVNDALLYQAKLLCDESAQYYSYNSLIALAALLKARNKGYRFKFPVVIASGL